VVDECRVAVVDKYPIFRAGIVHAIGGTKNLTVVAEGSTAEDAERIALKKRPDILLLEAAVPNSLSAVKAILHAHRNVKVIILASAEDLEYAARVVQVGAHGYIVKGITGPELVKAIAAVRGGERYIAPDLAWRLVAKPESPRAPSDASLFHLLSVREQQVLNHTARGLSNAEIARVLGLGLSTIKYYKTLAFRKMRVRNRVEAMLAAEKIA
jgi:DNA-binding NarL/FixJ family response regulator